MLASGDGKSETEILWTNYDPEDINQTQQDSLAEFT